MYPFSLENGDFFPSSLAYRIHVSGKSGHGKRIFLKDALQSRNFGKHRLAVQSYLSLFGSGANCPSTSNVRLIESQIKGVMKGRYQL